VQEGPQLNAYQTCRFAWLALTDETGLDRSQQVEECSRTRVRVTPGDAQSDGPELARAAQDAVNRCA